MRYVIARFLVPLFIVLAAAPSASAQATSIEGNWRGSGVAVLTSGEREPVRCHIRYEKSKGRSFLITAKCAHAGGTFHQSGRIVRLNANTYSGRLYSDEFQVSGKIRIVVSGRSQTFRAVSEEGRANLVLRKK